MVRVVHGRDRPLLSSRSIRRSLDNRLFATRIKQLQVVYRRVQREILAHGYGVDDVGATDDP
jgi:hypothetical protein